MAQPAGQPDAATATAPTTTSPVQLQPLPSFLQRHQPQLQSQLSNQAEARERAAMLQAGLAAHAPFSHLQLGLGLGVERAREDTGRPSIGQVQTGRPSPFPMSMPMSIPPVPATATATATQRPRPTSMPMSIPPGYPRPPPLKKQKTKPEKSIPIPAPLLKTPSETGQPIRARDLHLKLVESGKLDKIRGQLLVDFIQSDDCEALQSSIRQLVKEYLSNLPLPSTDPSSTERACLEFVNR